MQFLILLTLVGIARAGVVPNCSDVVAVNGVNHEKEVLKTGLDSAFQLSIDFDKNVLFFSYSTPNDEDDKFKSAYLDLKTNEFGIIKNINGGFANAVDGKNKIVYLGGSDGIYKLNFEKKDANAFAAEEINIWQILIENKIYFTGNAPDVAYYLDNGVAKKLPELEGTNVTYLAFDKKDNIIFSNTSGIFCYKKENSEIVNIGKQNIQGVTKNAANDLFFSNLDGIYTIDEAHNIKQVAEIDYVYGLAIEADNTFVYADQTSIIRLKPTKLNCPVESEED